MTRHAAWAALCLALGAGHASAHAFLETASPRVGSTVPPPAEVSIGFTQDVEPAFSSIAVQDASGASVSAGAVHPGGDRAHLAVPLKPLAAGTYTVRWHATSVDTHKTEGSFSFTVRP